jgi:hypothetical protein
MSKCTIKCPQLLPEGSSYAHCTSCHLTFSGETAFDKHRKGDDDNRHCLLPEQVGLEPYDKAIGIVFGWPKMSDEKKALLFNKGG